jgi:ubiquinone/menaquinone biosynthesis C-methylase UbiE
MSLYSAYIFPPLIDWVMNAKQLSPLREELLRGAKGTVAEIGFGSGRNLPFYPKSVENLFAIDPSKELLEKAKKRFDLFPGKITPILGSAENIPLDRNSVDCVISTFTLCSVPSTLAVLQEVKRILKPGGAFLFLEHGLAPDLSIQKWQKRLTPFQKRIAGGCHFDRNILGLLADACCDVLACRRFYIQGFPKVAGFVSMGTGSMA